ncbi:MAG: glycosyltransferase family 4 protein [Planctomycetes bacterium]|nr:glycosyltransferase family 4 protein [Planctomycetota bacterium]
MRILHLITTLDVGGAEMHLLAQTRGQTARGHEVHVAWLKGAGSLAPDFLRAGARSATRVGPAALLRRIRGFDLVHTHLLKADALGAVAALACGARGRLVSSKHNDEQVLKRPLVGLVHGWLSRVPRRVLVLSDHVGRFVVEHGRVDPGRVRRVYYGLDPAPFEAAAAAPRAERERLRGELGFGPEDVVFTCVARFAPQKAHDVLLRALDRARREEPRAKLLLVGDDPFGDGRRRAEALARELALGQACVFAGIRRDVPRILAASDAFVMCSLWEGLGLVFLEAMATGLAVLATNVSAVPEVVVDGETGLLVPPADHVPLAAAIVRLTRDPDLRARLAAAGARRVRERFGLERMFDATLSVYREALEA